MTIGVDASLHRVGEPVQRYEFDDGFVRGGDVAPLLEFLADPE